MKDNYALSEGFKMTELGLLSKDWEVVRIIDFVDFQRGTEPGSAFYNKEGKGIRFLRVSDISGTRDEIVYTISDNIRTCSEKDVLITFDGSPGIVRKGLSGAYSSGVRKVILRENNRILVRFVYFILQTNVVQKTIQKYSTGVTIKHASKSIPHIKIPLPPLTEQEKIAAVLSTLHEAKEKAGAVIEAARELKKSLMKYLFTYGPVPMKKAENVPLKETEIGPLPEEWQVVRLRDIVKKTEQKDPTKNPKWRFKYIDVSSINRENVKIIGYKLYQGKNAPNRAKKLVKNEDVIFATVRPTLKRLALINEKFDGEICSTAFCVLRAKENIVKPLYLFYGVGRNVFINELGKIQRGASYPAVKDSDVKNQKIPLPPLHIQQKITEILATVDEKIEAEENKRKTLEELFRTLLNNLMTAKIRVNHLRIAV